MRHISVVFVINLVVLALISASSLGQRAQQANSSTLLLAHSETLPTLVPDSDDSPQIPVNPALRGVMIARPQPPIRRPVLWTLFGPRADVGIFAVGNFNPVTNIFIQNEPHLAVSSNKSSLGGGFEYRRWLAGHTAVGLLYTQNPSDGKLLWQGENYIWPQMRRDISVLATESVRMKNFAPFVSGGPGVLLTNGYTNCGWSGSFAVVAGGGADYRINSRLWARTGITFLVTDSGCYGDPTCHAKSGMIDNLRLGLVYKWGWGSSNQLVR